MSVAVAAVLLALILDNYLNRQSSRSKLMTPCFVAGTVDSMASTPQLCAVRRNPYTGQGRPVFDQGPVCPSITSRGTSANFRPRQVSCHLPFLNSSRNGVGFWNGFG